MKIVDYNKYAFKIADATITTKGKLKFKYLDTIIDSTGTIIPQEVLKRKATRVYIMTEDGIIKKIGGSLQKGGIKNTLLMYEGGDAGTPSISRFNVNNIMKEGISNNKKYEIYILPVLDTITITLKGMFTEEVTQVNPSYKELEALCLKEYKNIESKYPDWNKQESREVWDVISSNTLPLSTCKRT